MTDLYAQMSSVERKKKRARNRQVAPRGVFSQVASLMPRIWKASSKTPLATLGTCQNRHFLSYTFLHSVCCNLLAFHVYIVQMLSYNNTFLMMILYSSGDLVTLIQSPPCDTKLRIPVFTPSLLFQLLRPFHTSPRTALLLVRSLSWLVVQPPVYRLS